MTLIYNDLGFMTVELESTYGTDPNSDPTALYMREAPDITPVRQNIEKPRVKATAGGEQHASVGEAVDFSFQTVVAALPFKDSALPALDPVMKAAGCAVTESGDTNNPPRKVEYTPKARAHDSATFKFYTAEKDSTTDYTQEIITGARVMLTFTYGVADEILVDVEGRGLYAQRSNLQDFTADEPTNLHNGNAAFESPNQTFSHGAAGDITNLEFSTGWDTNDRESATASSTVQEVFMTRESRHSGSYDPLATSMGGTTDDPKDMRRNDKAKSLALNIDDGSGSSSGAHWDLTAPKAQLEEAPLEEGNNHGRFGAAFVCNEDSGDDDFKITWETYS